MGHCTGIKSTLMSNRTLVFEDRGKLEYPAKKAKVGPDQHGSLTSD